MIQIGVGAGAAARATYALADFADVDASPVRCLDADATKAMVEEINVLRKRNESIGGIFELRAYGLVPGLGSHVSWEQRLDGRIARRAALSIQAAKGVGLGDGFDLAGRPGSEAHDEIFYSEERGYYRETNRSGGLEGGMTTGEPLVARVAMKPIPTLTKPLRSVDIATREPAQALRERTDSCVVPAAGVVGEAMLAIVLAGAYRDKFGGDHIDDVRRRACRLLRAHRMETPVLVFIGFMGAGKTTGARAAAAALGVRAIDTDRELEQRLGTSIEDYFASHGERAFREVEEDVVAEVLETPPAPVISLGGGAINSARVRELLARHTVVMLDVDEPTAWRRAGGKRRPLARDRERFAALHAERAPLYESLADAVLFDGGAETVRRAARRAAPDPARREGCCGRSRGDAQLPGLRRRRAGRRGSGRVRGRAVPAQRRRRSAPLYGDRIPDAAARSTMPPGEEAKTLATPRALLRGLAGAGMDHDDHVAALGGGVVGDVAGFCAAVYQRGVGVVQVPTTLVAQVDSAYGGKTGVDLPEGKNYVGAYHQPRAVLADPADAGDAAARRSSPPGWAEVIKTALIAGGPLWARVRRGDGVVDRDLVLACARTKLAVVARDERDAGRRQVLNLGHTVGHAIETATGYARYRHGEAVGLGLLAALTLSGQPDLRGEVAELLAARGLPDDARPRRRPRGRAGRRAARQEAPRRAASGFVLVEAPGDVRTGVPVAESDVRAALGGLR